MEKPKILSVGKDLVSKSFLINEDNHKTKKNNQILENGKIVEGVAICIFFINAIINYGTNYTYSFFICSVSMLILICSMIFVNSKSKDISRFIFVLVIHIAIIGLNYVEGIINGNYLYLFVFLVVSIFIFDTGETKQISIAYIICVLSIGVIFLFAPIHGVLQRASEMQEKSSFLFNIIFSVLTICILCLVLFKRNYLNEKLIKSKEQFLDAVFNTSLDAVLIIDAETSLILNCNTHCLAVFNLQNHNSFNGISVNKLFHSLPKDLDINFVLKDKNESWKGEIDCETPDGIVFPGYVSIVPFVDNEKDLKKISILDISDIKKAQKQTQLAIEKAEDAVKAKAVFLSNMSHELRTPLNGIIGITNLMYQDSEKPAKDNNNLEILKYSSEHMLDLINDVLDFSKIEAGKMDIVKESFNLETVLHNLKTFFRAQFLEKNIELIWQTKDNDFTKLFLADKTRITQVLSNLISNALKFTTKGFVKLVVSTEKTNEKFAVIKFSVIDTGIGIPKDKREIIFESFGQADTATNRKFGGTGLGLAISKKIVEQYNGNLTITDNNDGIGSNFTFEMTLPYDSEISKAKIISISSEILPPLTGLSVLIVEDNPINMVIAKKFLGKWGIKTTGAVNGLKALDVLKENTFDLFLIDLEMPEMDGHELIKELRKTKNLTPSIAFTAAGYENIYNDLLSKGFNDYVQKPFIPEELYNKIKKHSNYAA